MSEKRYRLLDHTADIGIEIVENTLDELFDSAAFALFDIQVQTQNVEPIQELSVTATSDDLVGLMIAWLSELLFHFESSRIVFTQFDIRELSETHVRAACRGEPYNRERHGSRALVKGITYHQAVVKQVEGGWFAHLIFDV